MLQNYGLGGSTGHLGVSKRAEEDYTVNKRSKRQREREYYLENC